MNLERSYKPFGEHAILIEWPNHISKPILEDLTRFKNKIKRSEVEHIREIRAAYQSILIVYHSVISFEKEVDLLKNIYNSEAISSYKKSKLWKIPVCYDDAFGLDLETMSASKNMSKADIVKRHSEVIYTVYFIGFLPGFLYLGGLDDALITPRKSTPRPRIEKGSVAIGGNQTGIYPSDSPGGWNIIGQTPVNFFNPNTKTPCFAQSNDSIQFYPVSLKEFENIKLLVDADNYQIESEDRHD
ncbi:5-oxoprolinase subunit PxpB [Formosa sp. 3Alg 14/1]|uniref:5-oxoprolinase subunit PxpB n=1 Tax=Formosa sp. 3Alg 14/1 TaxID=3382190 RepID=UPI0039BE4A1E